MGGALVVTDAGHRPLVAWTLSSHTTRRAGQIAVVPAEDVAIARQDGDATAFQLVRADGAIVATGDVGVLPTQAGSPMPGMVVTQTRLRVGLAVQLLEIVVQVPQ